jgi:5,10-methylenetetrahydromethanopterin reductase
MDFGCVFFGNANVYPAVALAERRGFTHAWLYDSQMLTSDVYAALALCAVNTKKIVLGPGVTNPASRIAPMSAIQPITDPKETIEEFSKQIIRRT